MTVKIFAEIIFYIGHALTPFAPSIHRQLKPPGDKPTGLPSRNRNASLTEKYWFQTNFIPSISKETGPVGQRAGTKKPPCKSPIYIVLSIWRRTRCAPRHPLKLLRERVTNPPSPSRVLLCSFTGIRVEWTGNAAHQSARPG